MKTLPFFIVTIVFVLLVTVACGNAETEPAAAPTAVNEVVEETAVPAAENSEAACTSINILYHERVPYLQTISEGVVEGITATPARTAFEEAGIPYEWILTPSIRQLDTIKENTGCDCSVGWFKNPEREQFARYTLDIYQDRPQIAIARADNDRLQSEMTVDEVLSNPDLVLGVKDGYSYGIFLDGKITELNPTKDGTTGENINMLLKVHEGHNDYFFIAPEEADALIESSDLPKEDFKYITFTDMPDGEKRYIICSQRVSDETIEKLDAAILEHVQNR